MSKPLVVLLQLEDHDIFEKVGAHLLSALKTKARLCKAKTSSAACRYLSSTARPHAVIVVDAAVTYPEYREVLLRLEAYVKDGGTAIYAGIFSSVVKYPDLEFMFKESWGLPWRASAYTREDTSLNSRGKGLDINTLVKKYNVNATYIGNVALDAAVYLYPRVIRILNKGKTPVQQSTASYDTPAAFSVVGKGHLGYVGDVNSQQETTPLILAMCFFPRSRAPLAPGTGVVDSSIPVNSSGTPTPSSSATRRKVLIISLEKDDWIDEHYEPLYRALKKRADVSEVFTARAAIHSLSNTPPDAVLLSDAAITKREYSNVLNRLIEYVQGGGTAVLGMLFSNHLPLGKAREFFARWGVPWDAGQYFRTTFALNPAGIPAPLSKDALHPSFSMKAVHLKNVPRESAVYLAASGARVQSHVFAPTLISGAAAQESPAVFTRVGSGHLGYVGDVNGEQESLRILIEMCGVKILPGDMGQRMITTSVSFSPGSLTPSNIEKETESEIPLPQAPSASYEPSPTQQLQASQGPRAREAEVTARAAARKTAREEKLRQGDILKTEGNEFFVAENWTESAEKYCAAALIAGPQPVYLSNLAASLLKMKLWELADSAASRVLLHEPKHIKALYRRAQARKELCRFKAAEADIRLLLALDPKNASALAERDDIRKRKRTSASLDWPGDAQLASDSTSTAPALEIEDESDSEDYTHDGNGTPCKFHNHGGCRHGKRCRFKHAPDSKSVRDELGRNVCVYWLLGQCRFGDRCVYAHDRDYLARKGWWTDGHRVGRLRKEFADAVSAASLPIAESMLPEALKPAPWRRDLWAVRSFALDAAAEEEQRRAAAEFGLSEIEDDDDYDLDDNDDLVDEDADGEDGWVDEDEEDENEEKWEREMAEREQNMGWTNDEFEELMCQGIKPWDINSFEEMQAIRDVLFNY